MQTRRLSIKVHGRVQGVGFRFFTVNCARKHVMSGWVRNCSDGGVAMEVQGVDRELEAFKAAIREGPMLARVHDMQVIELPPIGGERSFEVRS
ncbi:MAG: acylphosphatase [Chitinispirillaceae bacterium]|nr:acylphosphatase [Chitinispirillaceae bacterium]